MLLRVLAFAGASVAALAAVPQGCVGSVAVTTFRLTATPVRGGAASAVPIRRLNNLPAGYRVRYQPVDLPADLNKDAKLTLVLVPKSDNGQVTVLEPRLVANATEWQMPVDVRVVLLVFAPQGLDEKRLTNLVTRDQTLVQALADYADQTEDLEDTLEALNNLAEQTDEENGLPRRASTPTEQALLALVRALNPAASSFDPLGAGRRAGPSTLMGKGADAFFQNAGGFVPGGGILPEVKNWLMPDTDFRSVYTTGEEMDQTTLCAQRQPKTRNKIAYLWAYRLSTLPAPALSLVPPVDLPIGMRVDVPLKVERAAYWRFLPHAYDWALVPEGGAAPLRAPAQLIVEQRALRLDLRKFVGAPGAYHIEGKWDGGIFSVNGPARLHRLGDLKAAAIMPDSQDRLIAGSGYVGLDLRGTDFVFVDRAWMRRPGSAQEIPVELPAERTGASDQLRVEVGTDGLRPGPYVLALARVDGATAEIPLRLLPSPPKLDGPAPRVNIGETRQTVTFHGSGLDRVTQIESDGAEITLKPAVADGTRLEATVQLRPGAQAGVPLTLLVKVAGMNRALRFPGALQVAAARPRIRESRLSVPRDLTVTPRDGELPGGSWVSFALQVEPAGALPSMTLQCAEADRTVQTEKLAVGEKHANAQLTQSGDGALFLSLDPGTVGQSGCSLTATIETEELGQADPFPLGKVVRFPRVESFSMTDEKSTGGYFGELRGFALETIEKTGWSPDAGLPAPEPPRPIAAEGAKQSLRIDMPWPSPSPKAPLFLWLRGETEARATRVTQ
jgi:hypothetical protein